MGAPSLTPNRDAAEKVIADMTAKARARGTTADLALAMANSALRHMADAVDRGARKGELQTEFGRIGYAIASAVMSVADTFADNVVGGSPEVSGFIMRTAARSIERMALGEMDPDSVVTAEAVTEQYPSGRA